MSKRFLIILAVLVLGFIGFFIFGKNKSTAPGSQNNNAGQTSNHVQGAGKKGVTFVEYGDFQCPACGEYYPIVEQVRRLYGDDITFQFRNFPLVQVHQNAMAAHRAAEAAGKQGKFWDMYNALYSQQQTWSSAGNVSLIFESFAKQLGLNVDQFRKDYQSEAVNNTINADIKEGQGLGITGTPTFFINGKKVDPLPDRSVDAFKKLIDQAILEAQSSKQ